MATWVNPCLHQFPDNVELDQGELVIPVFVHYHHIHRQPTLLECSASITFETEKFFPLNSRILLHNHPVEARISVTISPYCPRNAARRDYVIF
jgi:hypothetical protein